MRGSGLTTVLAAVFGTCSRVLSPAHRRSGHETSFPTKMMPRAGAILVSRWPENSGGWKEALISGGRGQGEKGRHPSFPGTRARSYSLSGSLGLWKWKVFVREGSPGSLSADVERWRGAGSVGSHCPSLGPLLDVLELISSVVAEAEFGRGNCMAKQSRDWKRAVAVVLSWCDAIPNFARREGVPMRTSCGADDMG
jgi:hypothetical protein